MWHKNAAYEKQDFLKTQSNKTSFNQKALFLCLFNYFHSIASIKQKYLPFTIKSIAGISVIKCWFNTVSRKVIKSLQMYKETPVKTLISSIDSLWPSI